MNKNAVSLLVASLLLAGPTAVFADPPPWAPAHGHRAKHGQAQPQSEEREVAVVTVKEVGIPTGSCNRDTVGAVLGGVVGGVVGAQVGRDQGNEGLGIVIGSVAGILIGHSIGKQMDDADKQCSVQVFEHAKNGQTVSWQNPEQGVEYRFTPINTFQRGDQTCRKYKAIAVKGGQKEESQHEACRAADGEWKISG